MKPKNEYNYFEHRNLIEQYRKKSRMSTGSTSGVKWYRRGVELARKGDHIDTKNYNYYYDFQKHNETYEKKGREFFEKAAKCFLHAAELGNDLAMMNYALYLFSFKREYAEALKWFTAASEAGLALADYQLAVFYKEGLCSVEINEETANRYMERYKARCAEDERQMILAEDMPKDWSVIGRSYMYGWFCGYNSRDLYDTIQAKPSKWKYE